VNLHQMNSNWVFFFYMAMFVEQLIDVELTFDSFSVLIHPTDQIYFSNTTKTFHFHFFINVFTLSIHWQYVFYHLETISKHEKRLFIGISMKLTRNIWLVFCHWCDVEECDFVFLMRQLILLHSNDQIDRFLRLLNPNWY